MNWLTRLWDRLFRRVFARHLVDILSDGQATRRDLGELVLWSLVNRPRSWTLVCNRLDHMSGRASVWADGCAVWDVNGGWVVEGQYLEYLIPAFDAHPEVVQARRSGRDVD